MDELGRAVVPRVEHQRVRRGVFHSVEELIEAIEKYLKVTNKTHKPFV